MELKEKVTIIESVDGDLWNLTTKGRRAVTIFVDRLTHTVTEHGQKNFLNKKEIERLFRYGARVRVKYKDYIFNYTSVMVEWSLALNTNVNHMPVGDPYFVFYECRVVK
ncbi:hypothetical protein HM1_0526 [Heliomicrobium modesticaldum Ice1]|uniref:Uncharacterized protein n=2 Tax=Heliomicrobium modesticaldum TaxID=35701 RepID=B0TFY3_HELMI|nr:hypothetical protein HM1_0526 [Heliomicrobium modesticaldum Ice1]